MKVLVVDDQFAMRLLVRVNLQSDFVQVLEAENGHEAVEIAQRERPDVILLDVMMPGIDGFETAEILAVDPRTSSIPIVFLSARAEYASQARGLALGAADYITKPFNPASLFEAIETLLADLEHGRLDELRREKLHRLQALLHMSEVRTSLARPEPPQPPAAHR
jgi:CheY-like chemotaxis protein